MTTAPEFDAGEPAMPAPPVFPQSFALNDAIDAWWGRQDLADYVVIARRKDHGRAYAISRAGSEHDAVMLADDLVSDYLRTHRG